MTIELTEDQINSYPAGRELDALIAEHIFGSEIDRDENREPYHRGSVLGNTIIGYVLPYSTTDRALEAVDKFIVGGLPKYPFSLNMQFDETPDGVAFLEWVCNIEKDKQVTCYGDTRPLVICRALLLSVKYAQG